MTPIYITPEDNSLLRRLLLITPYTQHCQREREALRRELDRAMIQSRSGARGATIGLGSHFRCEDPVTGAVEEHVLCLPGDDVRVAGGLSILSDLGVAVIGCSNGDEIHWSTPTGRRRILIREVRMSHGDAESAMHRWAATATVAVTREHALLS